MVCAHLAELENALIAGAAVETYRGQPWTRNCREWVYFDVVLDIEALQRRFDFGPTVSVHENLDSKSGQERGFVCDACHDAVLGVLDGRSVFR